jgi:cytosine deaminase
MAAAGISVTALPLTDLYINGKNAEQPIPRGLTAIESLLEADVTVSCGGNNIRNAFTPFGRGDPILNASILAITAQMGAQEQQARILEMITRTAATTLGLDGYGIEVGGRADLVLLDTEDPRLILSEVPDRLLVLKNGRITMSRMGCTDRKLTE